MSAVVEAHGLSKSVGSGRGARTLFSDLDLTVGAGELVAVIGRSGSGKSTLLHLLGGLDRPDAGEIAVAGVRIDRCSETELIDVRRRLVGFVFQFFHLLPELTGAENVLLPARLAGDGPLAEQRARELIERLGVTDAAERLPGVLSGGEQQRLALARAWALDPDVLFLDEPTASLDPAATRAVEEIVAEFHARGTTIVMTTHSLPQARRLADTIVFMSAGRVVEQTAAEDFFNEPRSSEGRAFLEGERW
jgi:ABC-type lipoprotein export system ATPase subunit